jgi:hypothetical protein
MIQMLFFLRFRTQLRRTRPELIASLNDSIASAINAAGGSFNSKNRLMSVSFNEESLGFWLDIITLIETIGKTLEKSSSELFGYALILGRNIEDYDEDRLGRVLSSPLAGSGKQRSKGFLKRPSFLSAQGGLEKMDLARHTGVWCDEAVQEALGPYGAFEKSLRRYEKNQVRNKDIFEKYAELVRYTSLSGDVQALPEGARFPFREKILQSIQ